MATVQIDDVPLKDLLEDARQCGRSDEPSKVVADLIRTARWEHDHGRCGLTGCKTRGAFRRDLNRDTWAERSSDRSLYEQTFLCLDIDNFKRFMDHEGFGRLDEVLASIGNQLLKHFGEADTYRYGGDEFVVRLRSRDVWVPTVPDAITLKWAAAEVRVHRNKDRNHHLNGWIEHHIAGAILAARNDGTRLRVLTPDWMLADRV